VNKVKNQRTEEGMFPILTTWIVFTYAVFVVIERFVLSLRPDIRYQKARYIARNIAKGILMTILSVISFPTVNRFVRYEVVNNRDIGFLALMYAIPHIYLLNQETVKPSNVHHEAVGYLSLISLFHDYNVTSFWDILLLQTYLRTFTGLVDFYLGARFLLPDNQRLRLRRLTLAWFIPWCLVSWSVNLWEVFVALRIHSDLTTFNEVTVVLSYTVYSVLMGLIFFSDVCLIQKIFRENEIAST
jgi:hypothetical protein